MWINFGDSVHLAITINKNLGLLSIQKSVKLRQSKLSIGLLEMSKCKTTTQSQRGLKLRVKKPKSPKKI